MASHRNGPLVLLILASLIVAGAWTTASARESRSPVTIAERGGMTGVPLVSRASGEPDVGGTPRNGPDGDSFAMPKNPVVDPTSSPLSSWLRWVVRTWRVLYPGLS